MPPKKVWTNHTKPPTPTPFKEYVWCEADDRKTAKQIYEVVTKNKSTALDTEFSKSKVGTDDFLQTFQLSGAHGQRFVLHAQWLREAMFRDWLSDPRTKIVYFAFAADADSVEAFAGIDLERSFYVDAMVSSWCVDNMKHRYGLKTEGAQRLKWIRKEYDELFYYVPDGGKQKVVVEPYAIMNRQLPDEMLRVMSADAWIALLFHYGADDAEETHGLHRANKVILKRHGYWNSFLKYDAPYTVTMRHFQKRGIPIDMKALDRIDRLVTVDLMRHETCIKNLCGKPEMKLAASSVELRDLIFKQWRWPIYEDLMSDGGKKGKPAPQLNKVAWARYAKEEGFLIAQLMLPHNKLKTLKGTFLNGLRLGVKYGPGAATDTLYSDYNQIGTRSGRMSSRKFYVELLVEKTYKTRPSKWVKTRVKAGMNMLNFPNAFNDIYGQRSVVVGPLVRDADGKQVWTDQKLVFDKAEKKFVYVKTKKKFKKRKRLVVGDFSGFELWLMLWNCHKFGIKSEMLKALKAGKDVHSMTTVAVCELDCSWEDVKKLYPDLRNGPGKRCNFNLGYGGGAYMLCAILGMDTRDERNIQTAKRMIEAWNDLWPEVARYQRRVVSDAYEFGYVVNIAGQRLHLQDGLDSGDEGIVRHYENMAKALPCQSSAAVITKAAQNIIENDEELIDYGYEQYFNVYDEIVGAVDEELADRATVRVAECMREPFADVLEPSIGLLPVEVKHAPNWLEGK